jgi:DNA (cytosine-5)-methyltransferase 1
LFFDIERILEAKRPLAFMLENVRNLKSHDKGQTFQVIIRTLRKLNYWVPDPAIIDARHWRPQHRERIFIVGFRKETGFDFSQVHIPKANPTLASVLHPENGKQRAETRFTDGPAATVDPKYTLTKHLWQYLKNYKAKHEAAGNGFGYGLVTPDMVARTLSARYYKDGSEILISRGKGKVPRRLTPRECARLMGFPDTFQIPVSDTQAYKQFGNSVVVPVVEAVAKAMAPHVLTLKAQMRDQQLSMVV